MTTPIIKIVNAANGEVNEREMTAEEIAKLEAAKVSEAAQATEQASLAAAKQAAQDKLKALGLTDIEISAITGGK